jgi:hypothetical protein
MVVDPLYPMADEVREFGHEKVPAQIKKDCSRNVGLKVLRPDIKIFPE